MLQAACTAVILGCLEMQNMVYLQIKSLKSIGLILALVGYELYLDGFAELLFSKLPDLRTLLWGQTTLSSWCIYSNLETAR